MLARTGLYRYQRDPVDIRRWVLDQVAWPPGARVLDVGCGPGRYLAKLAELVPDARRIGMDLSAGMAAEAQRVSHACSSATRKRSRSRDARVRRA